MTILSAKWWSAGGWCIGAVAVETTPPEDDSAGLVATRVWKAYLGVTPGLDQLIDQRHIAENGAKLLERDARGLFPHIEGHYAA